MARLDRQQNAPLNNTSLTGREREVIELIQQGLTNAEIGQHLGLSPWTVKRHVARVLAKTGCRRRVDLAVSYVPAAELPRTSGKTEPNH